MDTPPRPLLSSALLLTLLAAGCEKRNGEASSGASGGPPAASPAYFSAPLPRPVLTCTPPPGWVEEKPTGMRAASFSITGDSRQQAYLAVIPLEGSPGDLLATVNQWRRSVDLPEASAAELPALLERRDIAGRSFQLVDFVSEKPLPTNERRSRLVVAFCQEDQYRWYFKLAGDAELVATQKPVLLEFLRSVKFGPPA